MDEPANRDGSGRFPKGVSGNPAGRPKMDPEVREILAAATPHAARRLVEALDAQVVVHYQGIEVGTYVDQRTRIMAAEALFNRLYGKPPQELVGEDGGPVRLGLVFLPPENEQ